MISPVFGHPGKAVSPAAHATKGAEERASAAAQICGGHDIPASDKGILHNKGERGSPTKSALQ